MNIRIGVISLGCDKNTVDTERVLAKITNAGFEVVTNPEDADYIIINTCAFIESAKIESIDTIMEMARFKNKGCRKLIVIGCLVSRYYDELKQDLFEADYIVKINDYDKIIEYIIKDCNNYNSQSNSCVDRVLSTPYHYSYLKISDGCNNRCTYCSIPSIRGQYKSDSIEDLVDESKRLIDTYGIKELVLVAQDVTRYGYDLYGKNSLLDLLDELEKLDIQWIRLMYCYPELVNDELIRRVSCGGKVVKYLDIPMQHINKDILKRMNRNNSSKDIYNLLDRIRNIDDNISIRSTFIAGFPGEGEQEFNELLDFIKYAELDNCGFFGYSREEGTPAYKMPNQIGRETITQRVDQLYQMQTTTLLKKYDHMIGTEIDVMYEGIDYDNQCFQGRSYRSAPKIDSKVLFKCNKSPDIGDTIRLKVIGNNKLDLVAEPVGD